MLSFSRPTPGARAQLLQESESQFQKSNESAYSADTIVPSRNSVTTSQRDSYVSDQSQDTIEYRRLSFEKRLFMSKVYIRSSKDTMIKELSRARIAFRRKDTATATDRTIKNWEAIRDQPAADSLPNPSYDVSVNTEERINSHTYSQSTARFFDESKVSHMTGMTFDEHIIWAYKQGDSLQVQRLIERGLDLHAVFEDAQYFGMKGIHVATMHGHINVIETLLAHGVTIEDEDASWFRRRPLHIAANSGKSAVARFLIRKGAQVDAQAYKGVQPIHEASRSGSITILDSLIVAGAAIDCSNWTGYQPIHWAAMSPKRSDVITYILEKGADIEAKTLDGYRPLHLACRSDPTNLRTLIALGAKIEYEDGSACPLEMAIIEDSKWAVWYLLNNGADPNRRNHAGNPVLHTLALYGWASPNSIEICQLLLEKGADVDLANNVGNRLLHCLAIRSPDSPADTVARAKVAKLALDQGADIDAINENGMSPLHLAILRGNRPLSKLLLERGARKLKSTVAVRANVQVTTLDDSYTPKYTVNIWRGLNNPEKQWRLSTQSFELSIDDDEGYSSMVCEALGDDRA